MGKALTKSLTFSPLALQQFLGQVSSELELIPGGLSLDPAPPALPEVL